MIKEYLVIGSNNFWYSTESNLREAKRLAKEILSGDCDVPYADEESGNEPNIPERVYIYRAEQVEELEANNEEDED